MKKPRNITASNTHNIENVLPADVIVMVSVSYVPTVLKLLCVVLVQFMCLVHRDTGTRDKIHLPASI
jgi:hypothetical protein